MSGSYSAAERRLLEERLGLDAPLLCPACGATVAVTPVETGGQVSYVRRRTMLICTGCRRSAAVDTRATG